MTKYRRLQRIHPRKCHIASYRVRFATILSLALTFLSGCTSIKPIFPDLESESSKAYIAVGDPQVFSRESLINDRLREQEFILGLLQKSAEPGFEIPSEIQRQVQMIRTISAGLKVDFDPAAGASFERSQNLAQLQNQLQALRLQAQIDAQLSETETENAALIARVAALEEQVEALQGASPGDASTNSESSASADQSQEATIPAPSSNIAAVQKRIDTLQTSIEQTLNAFEKSDLGVSPIDHFRDLSAYRAELRGALDSARLDDSHDHNGNTLYRLRVPATIFPGENEDQYGAVHFQIEPGDPGEGEVERLYFDWLEHLTYRLNEWGGSSASLNSASSRIPDLQLPMLESADLFRIGRVGVSTSGERFASVDHKCARVVLPTPSTGDCYSILFALPPGQERFFPPDFYNFKYVIYGALLKGARDYDSCIFDHDKSEIKCEKNGGKPKKIIFSTSSASSNKFEKVLSAYDEREGYNRAAITTILAFATLAEEKTIESVSAQELEECIDDFLEVEVPENYDDLAHDKRKLEFGSYTVCMKNLIKDGSDFNEYLKFSTTSRLAIDNLKSMEWRADEEDGAYRTQKERDSANRYILAQNAFEFSQLAEQLEPEILALLLSAETFHQYKKGFLETRKTLPVVIGGLQNRMDIPPNALKNLIELAEIYRRLSNLTDDVFKHDMAVNESGRTVISEGSIVSEGSMIADGAVVAESSVVEEGAVVASGSVVDAGAVIREGAVVGGLIDSGGSLDRPRFSVVPTAFREMVKNANDLRIFVYDLAPNERVQRISTISDSVRESAIAASVAAALPSAGVGAGLNASYGKKVAERVQAIERNKLSLAYRVAPPEGKRDSDVEKKKVGYGFGWLFAPSAYIEPKNFGDGVKLRHEPAYHQLTADLSVPAWLPSLRLKYRTAWVGNWRSGDFEINSDRSKVIDVRLPQSRADLDSLTRYAFKSQLGFSTPSIRIVGVAPANPSLCNDTTFIIRGPNLWRNPKVRLGGIEAKPGSVSVLPDMDGIEASFSAEQLRRVIAGAGKTLSLSVLTQTGMDEFQLEFAPIDIEGDICKRKVSRKSPAIVVSPSSVRGCLGQESITLRIIPKGIELEGNPHVLLGGIELAGKEKEANNTAFFDVEAECAIFAGSGTQQLVFTNRAVSAFADIEFLSAEKEDDSDISFVTIIPGANELRSCEKSVGMVVSSDQDLRGTTGTLLGITSVASIVPATDGSDLYLFQFDELPTLSTGKPAQPGRQEFNIKKGSESLKQLQIKYVACPS